MCGEKSTGGCSERLVKYRLNKVLSQEHGYLLGDTGIEAKYPRKRPALFFSINHCESECNGIQQRPVKKKKDTHSKPNQLNIHVF